MTFTRRHFLAAAPALPFAWRSLAQSPKHGIPRWVYFGTDAGQGIYRCRWDASTGTLGQPELAVAVDQPNFFALHPSLPVLYTANSGGGAVEAGISAYSVDASAGTLSPLNRLATHGAGPCFISVDRTGHAAYAANYTGGSLTAFKLGTDGRLVQTVGVLAYHGAQHGPAGDRQDAAHLHCATLSPDNRFVLVCDLGDDLLLVFPVAPEQGASIQAPLRFPTPPSSGPRHVAFHPNGKWLYCMHELDCTVGLYDWTFTNRTPNLALRPGGVVSTLPSSAAARPDSHVVNTGCEVIVSDDGRFLTTCTRGVDNIVVYRIDPAMGLLREQQRLSCGGQTPRQIAFDPSRRWLLAMNQGSSTVTVFANNPANGRLAAKPRSVAVETPMCAVWV